MIVKMLVLVRVLRLTAFANAKKPRWFLKNLTTVTILLGLAGCISISSTPPPQTDSSQAPEASPQTSASPVASSPSLPESTANRELLEESWLIYRDKFIQEDGRVIDFEASDRSTSEGQAYAMLRAVILDDPTTFALT
jgi:endoglucanase